MACLGPDSFAVGGREFVREELELQNGRHLMLQCSWYRPRETSPAPCIVYLHGNSGCRADADDALHTVRPPRRNFPPNFH